MTYIAPASVLGNMGTDMTMRSPEELKDFAREAAKIAIKRRGPITPPSDLSAQGKRDYVAIMEFTRRPDPACAAEVAAWEEEAQAEAQTPAPKARRGLFGLRT